MARKKQPLQKTLEKQAERRERFAKRAKGSRGYLAVIIPIPRTSKRVRA